MGIQRTHPPPAQIFDFTGWAPVPPPEKSSILQRKMTTEWYRLEAFHRVQECIPVGMPRGWGLSARGMSVQGGGRCLPRGCLPRAGVHPPVNRMTDRQV